MKIFLTTLLLAVSVALFSQANSLPREEVLTSGPMLGYCELKEAVVWVQTMQESDIFLTYYPVGQPDQIFRTRTQYTTREMGYTAKLLADQVQPGTTYHYDLYVNNKKVVIPYPTLFTTQSDWKFKTNPAPFTAAFGSCTYINEPPADRSGPPYGGDYHIFETIVQKKPDLMLWGGDNIYLRPVDWGSRTGFIHRYSHLRKLPELQKLMAACPQFAIWDDHDFGPNDANGSFFLKPVAHETFQLFWPNPNPVTFRDGQSICTQLEFNGIDFFTLDDRSFRTEIFKDSSHRQLFGNEQLEWLINNLKFSLSPFKMVMVGGQILNDARVFENFSNYPEERNYLLRRIEEENIKGVIFLTGDRHHSEISRYTNSMGNEVYDITSSPLTSGAGSVNRESEPNSNRIPGSLIQQRNFALLSFTGPFRDRILKVTFVDSNGKELYAHEIKEKDLSKKK